MRKIDLTSHKVYIRQKLLIMLLFFILVIIHTGLMIGNSRILLDFLSTRIAARSLAQSRMHSLLEALEPMEGPIHIEQVEKILGEMIMLEDSETGIRFISGVKVEMDYDVVKADKKELDIERGEISGEPFLVPIYSKVTRELIGIAKFYSSQLSIKKSRMKYRLIMLIGVITTFLITMVVLWLTLTHLFGKIKAAERELQEKQAQLIHTGRLKDMGEMAAGIAHEINQPLQVIKSAAPYLEAYFRGSSPQSIEAEAAQDILKHVKRVTGIIRNMISFVRQQPVKDEFIGLHDPLNKALSFFKEQFKNHDIFLEIPDHSSLENLPRVKMNPQEFMQIVVNLLSNARDAVDKKGRESIDGYLKKVSIRLWYASEREGIIFEVEDNGMGMSQTVKSRCLEPFFTTKEVGEGMGLGLSIVHTLTRKHNLSISIESIEGEGSIFRIFFPLMRKEMKK